MGCSVGQIRFRVIRSHPVETTNLLIYQSDVPDVTVLISNYFINPSGTNCSSQKTGTGEASSKTTDWTDLLSVAFKVDQSDFLSLLLVCVATRAAV